MCTGLPQNTGEGSLACSILKVTSHTHTPQLYVDVHETTKQRLTCLGLESLPSLSECAHDPSAALSTGAALNHDLGTVSWSEVGRVDDLTHTHARPRSGDHDCKDETETQSVWYIQHMTNEIIFLKCSWALERCHHIWIMTARSLIHTHTLSVSTT